MAKVKLFTHTDLDGVGCAVLAKLAFKDEVDITYCNYDDINKTIVDYLIYDSNSSKTAIYITDISVDEETAHILDLRKNVKLFDHHATALDLNKYDWCQVKVENLNGIKTCGTELFYDYLQSNGYFNDEIKNDPYKTLKNLVRIVRNYDTWRWTTYKSGEICKQVNDLFHIYGKDEFVVWCLRHFILKEGFPEFDTEDYIALDMEQKKIDKYIKKKENFLKKISLLGMNCGVVFAENYTSELGNKLCQKYSEIDFIAIINLDNNCVSFRTVKENINLGEIAKHFGGGGHPKSAAFLFNGKGIKNKLINKIFKLEGE